MLAEEGVSPTRIDKVLKDKFGLSWQIVPRVMIELLQDKDPAKSQRVMQAMMQMTKIDIAGLQRAYRSGDPRK